MKADEKTDDLPARSLHFRKKCMLQKVSANPFVKDIALEMECLNL